MTFEILTKTETQFEEIAGFYACLNANPFDALALLLENLATQRGLNAVQFQPSTTTTSTPSSTAKAAAWPCG